MTPTDYALIALAALSVAGVVIAGRYKRPPAPWHRRVLTSAPWTARTAT